jgi:deoxycytidylate deaminase
MPQNKPPELVIALVTPAGSRRADLLSALDRALGSVGYAMRHIRLSELLKRCSTVWCSPVGTNEAERISHYQKMGNAFRATLADGAALARASIASIREQRRAATGHANVPGSRIAYVLDQLKHPDEVDFLREVYGSCFFLIAGHAPQKVRETELAAEIAKSAGHAGEGVAYRSHAHDLIQHDDSEEETFGQNTRDTYPKADFFVDLGIEGNAAPELQRFIELLFGHPFHTPTHAEYAMYQASAASRRSSDDSRQVGAAITTATGDVIAVGANEAPFRGGGLYWAGESPDARDQALTRSGDDRAADIKASALRELLDRLDSQGWLVKDETRTSVQRAHALLPHLKGTQFINIGEFGRTVHAEMASLLDAARRGVSVDGNAMYVTTFPCHNCAKHIIAAGIRKVIYLEPYPKSRAGFLHKEEIELDPEPGHDYGRKLAFWRFSGVAPRQYHQLFGMADRGSKKGLSLQKWLTNRTTTSPRHVIRNAPAAYLAAEQEELNKLPAEDFERELAVS